MSSLTLHKLNLPDPFLTELGCFDEHDVDDFKLEWDGISEDQTPETCIYYCYNAGMRYAGTLIILEYQKMRIVVKYTKLAMLALKVKVEDSKIQN